MPMVMLLPTGKYDYDLYPLTEDLIDIDEDGNDVYKEVFYDGVIGIDDGDLHQIRITKKFADDLKSVVDMTVEEIAEEERARTTPDPAAESAAVRGQLTALDYLTNKYVEGKLSAERWQQVVAERDELRRRLQELDAR